MGKNNVLVLLATCCLLGVGCNHKMTMTVPALPPISRAALAGTVFASAPPAATVTFTPIGSIVLAPLHLKSVDAWSCFVCETQGATVTIAPERFYIAGAGVPWIPATFANNILTLQVQNSWYNLAPEYIELLIDAAGFAAGSGQLFTLSVKGLAKLAGGSALVHLIGKQLQAHAPNLAPFQANLLSTTPIVLGPGQCSTLTMYAGQVSKPVGFTTGIFLPGQAQMQAPQAGPVLPQH